jgi:N-glycosylase/DNA lyase
MMRTAKTYAHVPELLEAFNTRKDAIRKRLDEFAAVRPEEYFYELVYCLLTPQSSAVRAAQAVEALKAEGFHEKEMDAATILLRKHHYIRFHNTKAKRLHEVKMMFADVQTKLCNGSASPELRAWLVHNVKGLGWKEASHFLRNIGHRNLAILDRHILKNLKKHRVLHSIPKTLPAKRYLSIEEKFKRFASDVNISMDELDLLFWSSETGEILK